PNMPIPPVSQAAPKATKAAITNALLAAETTTGANDLRVYAMPQDRMLAAMKKDGRLTCRGGRHHAKDKAEGKKAEGRRQGQRRKQEAQGRGGTQSPRAKLRD